MPKTTTLPGGKVHELPDDLAVALAADETARGAWLGITVLARNEFICWVDDAKQKSTRERRIHRAVEALGEGKRRPCCWPGCKHRERDGNKARDRNDGDGTKPVRRKRGGAQSEGPQSVEDSELKRSIKGSRT
ncbi:uncharacterized protein DNG_09043 [Cephalotrichum gorgonifer]|uniref:Uncharacterized protein n=1 Tax=Cephalotrichum gorgonifer TaxID=2041049 RepID=A0AAE8N660_9PEZI|nr:uncharacterized protein DNG_09043 [Cephalotrichum gorgonifer]